MYFLKKISKKNISMGATFAIAAIAFYVMATLHLTYPLVIETADGRKLAFQVESADTPEKQERGLMFREELANDKGMLFVFSEPAPLTFWMRNTLIPLDMIFIGADHKILSIHHRAQPHDETPVSSNGDAIAVLEIPGGQAGFQKIAIGDTIRSSLLAGTAK